MTERRHAESQVWSGLTRYLAAERIDASLADLWVEPEKQRPSTLCYLLASGRALLLRRRKEPFAGCWTAPGGKVQPGEDPAAAIRREMQEETGLLIGSPRLAMIASETGLRPEHNWLLFIFTCDEYSGVPRASNEGELAWFTLEQLPDLGLPEIDHRLRPFIFTPNQRYFARIVFSPQGAVTRMAVRTL